MAILKTLVKEINIRNKTNEDLPLLGVSKDKEFIPSVANVIGTDLSTYKVVKKGQFATNLMHVDRDELVPVSLLKEHEAAIISPAYNVFEIIDESQIIPDYLLLCFKRKEFDRNAWFFSGSSIRGNLDYKKFLEIDIPLLSLSKQKEIVERYQKIESSIHIKEQINNNLLEQVDNIFKEIFGDLFDRTSDSEKDCVKNLGLVVCGKTPSTDVNEYFGGDIPFITIPDMHNKTYVLQTERTLSTLGANSQKNKYIPKGSVCVSCIASSGMSVIASKTSQTNQQINTIIPKGRYTTFFVYSLMRQMSETIKRKGEGGTATLNLNKNGFEKIEFIKPLDDQLNKYERYSIILSKIKLNQEEAIKLNETKELIIASISTKQ